MEEKVLEIQEELNQLNSQYSETCRSLNILDEKVFLLTRQIEELNEELERVRTNNQ